MKIFFRALVMVEKIVNENLFFSGTFRLNKCARESSGVYRDSENNVVMCRCSASERSAQLARDSTCFAMTKILAVENIIGARENVKAFATWGENEKHLLAV